MAAGIALAYVYDTANQLTEVHQGTPSGAMLATLTYDPNGSLTQKVEGGVTATLTYDGLNRLVQVDKPGLMTQNYIYDGDGRRIRETVLPLGPVQILNHAPMP